MSRFEPFCDWLTIKQRHALDSLPIVSDGRIISTDSGLTKIEWESLKHKRMHGSHDTSVGIRCDGTEVMLSGNIGRLGRPDNLFNLTFDQTIEKANRIVALYGLPPFTNGEQIFNTNPSSYDRKQGLFTAWTGATISNIHLTSNFATGSEDDSQRVIDWIDGQSASHIKKGRVGSSTAQFGSKGGRKLLKFYIKHLELMAHSKNAVTRELVKTSNVYRYAATAGVVRAELELHRLMLRDLAMRYLGDISMPKLASIFEQNLEILDRVKVDASSLDVASLPAAVRLTAEAYLRGSNLRAMLSQATWYRHAKVLREYGLDIAEPHNVKAFPIKLSNRAIEIKELQAPEWYWNESAEAELLVA